MIRIFAKSRIGKKNTFSRFAVNCLYLQMCNFLMFSSVLMFFSEVSTDFTKIRTTFVKHDYLPACVCVCGGTSLIYLRRAISPHGLFSQKMALAI